MTRPLIGIFDCATQQEITREMNDQEYEKYLVDQEAAQLRNAEESSKMITTEENL